MSLLVVVPVLQRPKNAAPFMESFRSSIYGSTEVLVVATMRDTHTIKAWADQGVNVTLVPPAQTSFPHKVQHAYEHTSHDWLLLVGDDVRFHHGWLEAAEAAMKRGIGLIATNDLGNPYVLAGTHATHPIIRRQWVDEQGASWDGPYHIAHTGYRHSYVDAEWSTKAKADGVFCYAPDCVIEHRHPTWGKGNHDTTYTIGMSKYQVDAELFAARKLRYEG